MTHRLKQIAVALFAALSLFTAVPSEAARVRVLRTHSVVRVHRGFPIRRVLPRVYVRRPRVAFRVAPRRFLAPLTFGAVVVTTVPERDALIWRDSETIEKDDEWTEFTLNADRRGSALVLDIARGPAQISFAEVVFDNGEAQVVDFDDHLQAMGSYALLDFKDGRKVDHVRVVAKADADASQISLLLAR
ncbi:MAG: hypothetical protein ABI639_11775 [Thermoanaerobaculia bacterium]